jgi:very-short-patch-repair endonuclease
LELLRKDFVVLAQHDVAGKRIDLVVEGGQARLAVECDGDHWHGADRYEHDMQRQRQLERSGWAFFHVREAAFYSNKVAALQPLWRALEERDIYPTSLRAVVSPGVGEEEREDLDSNVSEGEDEDEDSLFRDFQSSGRRAEEIPAAEIRDAIVAALSKCPNQSCTLHSLTSRVLKEVGVLTRGNPRIEFERRVMRGVNLLEMRERVEKYKAKNRRVRLLQLGTHGSPPIPIAGSTQVWLPE